jgi:C-terminal processing protease CtpA/Prc
MKKRFHLFTTLLVIALIFWGCDDNSTGSTVEEAPSQRQFVWEALNFWYFWQADVPELADNKEFFDSEQAYHDYLMGFQDAEGVFEDLLFTPENFGQGIGEDDFSFFIDDYEVFLDSRQGISRDFGFEYGLVQLDRNSSDIFGYVQYVLEDTPADEAGLTRGDIFTGINGTTLTVNNFRSLLANNPIELTLAESIDGEITETGETVTVNATQIQEDPVYLSKVIETGSAKVGYLLYNSFQTNSHQKLNDVFGNFISEGINELVLDLRYNGGGAVITSATLSSMISGLGSSETFAEYTFNEKRSQQGTTVPFQDDLRIYNEAGEETDQIDMNKLSSLDRLFVLTGFATASASESVINGLMPFMEVTYIGRQTVGKDDASLTLYDAPAPYTDRDQANPDHKNAIQPIVLKIRNADGQSNGVGFLPEGENFVREIDYLDNLPPLGDENDPLLARALQLISGEPVAKQLFSPIPFRGDIFKDSRDMEQFGKDMYILPGKAKEIVLYPSQ